MRKVPVLWLLLLVLALATGVTACGGDSADNDAYIEKVNAAQDEFKTEAGKLNLADPESPRAFKTSLDSLGGLLDKLVKDLEDTEVPEDVDAEHDKLVKSLRDYDTVLTENKDGLASGEQTEIRSSAQAIATGSTAFSRSFDSTIDAINKKLRE